MIGSVNNFLSSNLTKESIQVGLSRAGEIAQTVGSVANKCFKVYLLYSLYESALSDIFCLKTYRHGTNPWAVLSISVRGPNNKLAGTAGEAQYYKDTTGIESPWAARDQERQAFYTVADSSHDNSYGKAPTFLENLIYYYKTKKVIKKYAVMSTVSFLGSFIPLPRSWKAPLLKGLNDGITTTNDQTFLLTFIFPSVKLHLNPNRIGTDIVFEPDTDGGTGAYFTRNKISPLDIGIVGVLKNGLNRNLVKRITAHKHQFLWGVAQLVASVAFTTVLFPAFVPGGAAVGGVLGTIYQSNFHFILTPALLWAPLQL